MFRLTLAALAFFSMVGFFKPAPELASPPSTHKSPYSETIFMNLNMIRKIVCMNPETKTDLMNVGTGAVVAKGRMITAAHVLDKVCYDSVTATRLIPIRVDVEHDFAVLAFEDGSEDGLAYMPFRCAPLKEGVVYSSFGYANGQTFAMNKVVGTGVDTPPGMQIAHKPAEELAVVAGDIIPGMSGGPLIDDDGFIVGINTATDGDGIGFIRSLRQTALCQKS